MIVKGLIKTINFSDNSCTVRLPIFETAASQGEVVLKAVMLTQPGLYNGYSEGDIVFVDFENDKLNQPIVLGKLYLGAAKEETSPVHSSLAVSNLTVTSKATLPIDTQLVLEDTGNTVAVENGITTYKSLTDIIKALYKTETSVDKTTKNQAEAIANIKVEYLSQLASKSTPEATDPKWTIAIPNYRDSYAIWQKTTCYNHRGQILSREIICLTNINSSAAYRLRCSTRVHAGPNQTEALTVKAMVKIGSSIEVEDDSAILKYRWGEYDTPKEIAGSSLYFSGNDLQDKNLIVEFLHRDLSNSEIYNLYDTETIMYAPLNTPVIYFSKDTDVILYTADGAIKLGDDVENTAELYVNGDILPAEFTWSWDPASCTCDYASETNPDSKTIIVTGVNSDSRTGTATCTAIVTKEGPFFEKSYTKDFTVTQTRVGENATSYWLVSSCTVHTGKKHGEAITITAMKQFGTSTEEVDTSAILWWKYKSETSQAWKKAENDKYRLAFTYNSLLDDDILILATHNTTFDPNTNGVNITTDQNIYEREEITFSPLNTPILSLTNDSGAIPYGSNGQKMNPDDTVSTTAELYLNGTKLPDKDITYVWETVNCTAVEGESLTTPTITIKDLSTNTASATCTATYKDESYTKTFTVVKQIQGVSIVSQTTYYALVHNKFPNEDELSGKTNTLSSPSRTDLTVYVQAGDDTTSKRSLNRLDQATTHAAIEAAETWGEWSIMPPAHTEDTNGWKFWTTVETIYSSGAVSFSKPIINEDLSGVYALAQGKSTNYYSDNDPSDHYTIKEGDCWFKTTGTNTELEGSPNKGELKQWTNGAWKDIGSEIVANKLTATYINALNITAKKIKILNDDGNTTLFEADGLDKQHKVTIGGFEVNTTGLYTAGVGNKTSLDDDSKPGVYIGADGISIGKGFKVEAGDDGDTQVTLSEEVSEQISAVSYWLSSTCTVHTGSKHGQAITVTAMKKIGNAEESQDTEAYLWWRYKNATKANGESSDWALTTDKYRINFTFPDEIPDDDILIIATHSATFNPNTEGITIATDSNIYEREEIPFSPLNTPILNLTNDSASLTYDGNTKIGNDTASSTAELWLNGSKITTGVTYSWALSGCKNSSDSTSSAEATITVQTLSTNTATATCTATYNTQTYTKIFTITKQLKGEPGAPGNPGGPGDPGRSVLSTIKYYKLTNTTPDITSSYTDENPPSGWSPSPEPFTAEKEGYDYYETVRTQYNTADNNGHYYSWSAPVKNSMLTVDFLNALGITAKKIVVTTEKDENGEAKVVFSADGLNRTADGKLDPLVELGSFKVQADQLVGETGSGYVSISPLSIVLGDKDKEEAPFYVQNNGTLKATKGELSGFIIETERTGADKVGPVFKSKPSADADQGQFYTITNPLSSYDNFRDFVKDPSWVRILDNGKDVTSGYTVYESDSFHRSNIDSYARLTFDTDLEDDFTFYIASSAENSKSGDFITVSNLNGSTVVAGSYLNGLAHTYGQQLTLEDLKRTDATAPDAETTFIELTNSRVIKITLNQVKKGDYYNINFVKDSYNSWLLDTGWFILPSQASIERHNRIFITPAGSTADIAGAGRTDWGLTIGRNYGVTLNGDFFAIDANITGTLGANEATIGGIKLADNILTNGDLTLGSKSLLVTGDQDSYLALGITSSGSGTNKRTYPYLEFTNGGLLTNENHDSGFMFTNLTYGSTTTFRLKASVSGSGTSVKVTGTLEYQTATGDWVTAGSEQAHSRKTFYVKVKGDKKSGFLNLGRTTVYAYATLTLGASENTTSSYVSGSTDFNSVSNCFFVSSTSDSATEGSNISSTWTYSPAETSTIISLGSIIPGNSANSDNSWELCDLGAGDGNRRWRYGYFDNLSCNSLDQTSDRKAKNTINYDVSRYDIVFDTLKPVSYKYNSGNSGRTHLGFIAQDIQDSIKQANLTNKDCALIAIEGEGFDAEHGEVINEAATRYSIRPNELHALEVRQIQLLKAKVKQQEATITELAQRLEKLENKN